MLTRQTTPAPSRYLPNPDRTALLSIPHLPYTDTKDCLLKPLPLYPCKHYLQDTTFNRQHGLAKFGYLNFYMRGHTKIRTFTFAHAVVGLFCRTWGRGGHGHRNPSLGVRTRLVQTRARHLLASSYDVVVARNCDKTSDAVILERRSDGGARLGA